MNIFGKIFIPVILSLLVAAVLIGYTSSRQISSLVEQRIASEAEFNKRSGNKLATERLSQVSRSAMLSARLYMEQAALISSLDFVRQAYAEALHGDIDNETNEQVRNARNFLKESFAPISSAYTSLTGHPELRAHFHLPNNRSFARVWRHGWQVSRGEEKLDISDDLSGFRDMVVEINHRHQPLQGIELGIGGFVIRGLAPVTDAQGTPVGSVEVYTAYENLLRQVSLDKGMSLSLLMPTEQLAVAKKLRDPGKFPVLEDRWVEVYSSTPAGFQTFYRGREFSKAFETADYRYTTEEYAVYTHRVEDFSGKPIGMLVLSEDLREQNAVLAGIATEGDRQKKSALLSTMLLLTMLILFLGSITFIVARRIGRSVRATATMLQDMENGHLGSRLDVHGKDETALLSRSLNRFADNLQNEVLAAFTALAAGDFTFCAKGLIRRPLEQANGSLCQLIENVRQVGRQIKSGASQVAEASQQLSEGATTSAASLEQISSSINEMETQTSRNAGNTNQANQLSNSVQLAADEGSQQMQQMVAAMEDISDAGQNISKIIKTIDEIAFQTNLLALNAAVEAARAGQHGKGFAVVAEEVRNLAARSAKAARETTQLIDGSIEKTERGAMIAGETSQAFSEIVVEIKKMSELIGQIARSNNEQANGIHEINCGISQVDNVTQQNTASAEESAATAEQLYAQTEALDRLLANFVLHPATNLVRFASRTSQPKDFSVNWGNPGADEHPGPNAA